MKDDEGDWYTMYIWFLVAVVYRWRRAFIALGVSFWLAVFFVSIHILTRHECYNIQVLGDGIDVPCKNDADCMVLVGSTCVQSAQKCACPAGQIPSSDLATCLTLAENYDASCEDNAQCTGRLHAGGVCKDNACACKEGFHYLHGVCWRSVGLNGTCSGTGQCYENSNYVSVSCQEGMCGCREDFYLRGGRDCRREGKEYGDECTFDVDCRFNNAICKMNACAKPDGEEIQGIPDDEGTSSNRRKMKTRTAILCTLNSDCSTMGPNAECNSGGNCWCRRGSYMSTTNKCMLELGENCTDDEDCSHIKYAQCEQNGGDSYCTCSVKYTPSSNNRKCTFLRSFNTFCQNTYECLNAGPLSTCTNSLCSCQQGAHYVDEEKMCWTSKGIGAKCSSKKDCATKSGVEGIDCKKETNTCECIQGYHEGGGDCRRDSTSVGEPCVENLDCMYKNAQCEDDVCGCQHGFFVQKNEDKLSCARGIEAPCNDSADGVCMASKATCRNNTCSCDSDSGPAMVSSKDHSACLNTSQKYGDPCQESVQCQSPYGNNSDCRDGVCVCNENFHFRDQFCWPIKDLGQKCDRTSECYLEINVELSECRNGICQCLYDYEQDTTTRCISGTASLSSAIVTVFLAMWTCMLLK